MVSLMQYQPQMADRHAGVRAALRLHADLPAEGGHPDARRLPPHRGAARALLAPGETRAAL